MEGTVKWFSPPKGYGFIEREGEEDVFVYYTGIEMDGFKKLEKGQKVKFDLAEGRNGGKSQAINVKIL